MSKTTPKTIRITLPVTLTTDYEDDGRIAIEYLNMMFGKQHNFEVVDEDFNENTGDYTWSISAR